MQGEFWQSRPMRMMTALALLMVIIALGSYASLNFEKVLYVNPTVATVSVSGTGEVLAIPDIGQFSFSVEAKDEEAVTAQELSGTKINDIIAYLKEQGIEEKDIKTQNYNLYPQWRWETEICPAGSYCPGRQVQDGFLVTQTISVKVRETDKAGALIAGVGERGATNISNLNFTIDDLEMVKAEARAKAIADAKTKAAELANQLGVRIVRLVSYYEQEGYYAPYAVKGLGGMEAQDEAQFLAPDLPTGEESTKVQINLTYEIK